MGSSSVVMSGNGGGGWGLVWHRQNNHYNNNANSSKNNSSGNCSNNNNESCVSSFSFGYFLLSFVLLGWISSLYSKLMLAPDVRTSLSAFGCREDAEGAGSIGVFYGDSPFSLKPIEDMNVWRDRNAAWPVANPVVSCASVSEAGFPSNFVADPFLYVQGDVLYLFFETKNSVDMQGDIGVARSFDKGGTWEIMGIALDENWHLAYPYVFEYDGNVYMMPEGSTEGDLRLYRAVNFPMEWTLDKIILKKHLVDSVIVHYDGKYWLFGSDYSGIGSQKNGHLEIWYGISPLGPWKSHRKNLIYNTNKSTGARNGGRPFVHNDILYRSGQGCGESYGHRICLFKVEILTTSEFKEVEVPLGIQEPSKGRNSWNGARNHHLDIQQLSSGEWIGIQDGDRIALGDANQRLIIGCASFIGVFVLVILVGMLIGAVKCIVPLSWCPHNMEKRSDTLHSRERPNWLSSKIRLFSSRLNHMSPALRGIVKPNTFTWKLVLTFMVLGGFVLVCLGVAYIYGGSGAQEPYPLNGQYSQFTLLTMTYDVRLWNLKMYVKHYSRCASVREIVVVWNKGTPPELSEFDSAVPIRIRAEEKNSLNNRFKKDPLITTRAVLELDDDIIMTCNDVERGFRVWREHPDRIVGFYPRLVNGNLLKYRAERHARKYNGYNMILTGAAFMDIQLAFERYWSDEAKAGREVVDTYFNCEDVLLNYLYANASYSETVEYVKPAWAIDTSKFSGVAISKDTQSHYRVRSKCLEKFRSMYGSITSRKSEFSRRKDGWDA